MTQPTYELYDSLLSPVAVVREGLVVYFNQTFAQFFQLPPRKIRGKPVGEVVQTDGDLCAASIKDALAQSAQVVTPEVAVACPGAEPKEVVLKFFPVGQDVVLTIQDFSIERILHEKHRLQLDELKKYSEGLEVLVDERTRELRTAKEETESILKSIREGIFVVEKDLTIGLQCSAAACAMLGHEKLQGVRAVDALFPDASVPGVGELKKKIGDFLAAAFNLFIPEQFDDLIRFIPKAIKFPGGSALRTYSLSFSAVVDDGSVLRVVVAVRDDTELEELRNLASLVHRKVVEELEKIAGLATANATAAAYAGYLTEAAAMTAAVRDMLADPAKTDINAMFRHLHTVKGGARTYGLTFLQHFAHEAEGFLDRLRTDRSALSHDEQKSLTSDVNTLFRGVSSLVRLLPGESAASPVALARDPLAVWDSACRTLVRAAASLGQDLGKEIRLDVHASHALTGRDLALFNNVAVHLVRNAADHGIECAGVRTARGKAATGRIGVTVDVLNGTVFCRLEDDGGGVDLERVAAKGVKLGLLRESAGRLTLEQALQVLAAPGFSTREEVSDVSGRGVGLDSVVSDVRAAGGHLRLERSDARGTSFVFSWQKLEDTALPLDPDDHVNAA